MRPVTTTLNDIREYGPCESGWRNLLAHLGKTKADDEPLLLTTVLDSNGINDALWCLRALGPEHHGWMRHFAVDCAEDVKHLMTDAHSLAAMDVARCYADGQATVEELRTARTAAYAAAAAAADAAAYAAAYAAYAAAADAAADAYAAADAAADAAAVAAAYAAYVAAAADAAAADAADADERAKQTDRLRAYLTKGGRP